MREIEMFEINKMKCPVCGCRNKVYTELLDPSGHHVGFSLKCCACGSYKEFLHDRQYNGAPHPCYHSGRQRCIQPSYCPQRLHCKLYIQKEKCAHGCSYCCRNNANDCHNCIVFKDRNRYGDRDESYIKLIPLPDTHFN